MVFPVPVLNEGPVWRWSENDVSDSVRFYLTVWVIAGIHVEICMCSKVGGEIIFAGIPTGKYW